jgi:ring-1,2-phenylacetyl-CoA epoxidase subunit PaaD
MKLSKDEILEALKEVKDPCAMFLGLNFNLIEMGMIKDIRLHDDKVYINLRTTVPSCIFFFDIAQKIKEVLIKKGIKEIEIENAIELWTEDMMSKEAKYKLDRYRETYARKYGIKLYSYK